MIKEMIWECSKILKPEKNRKKREKMGKGYTKNARDSQEKSDS